MAPFTDLSPLLCLVYALAGPGMLAAMLALIALVRPNRRGFNAVVVLSLAPLLLGGLLVYALMWPETDVFREIVLAAFPSLCVLAGLAALTVVLALAALVRPLRGLRGAGLAALVVTVVACGFIVADVRTGILGEFFWQDGATRVRVALEQVPQRLVLPLRQESTALYLAAVAVLIAVPLLAAAALRARKTEGSPGKQALVLAALALPPVILAEATLVLLFAADNPCNCLPSGPIDGTPDIVHVWTTLAEQRLLVAAAGLLALGLGSLAAVRLARAGLVATNRTLVAACIVFLAGGAAYLYTRAHAADTADGPRRAFVGLPFTPFGAITSDWTYPDFIDPPSATSCTSLTEDPTAALMLAADGETIVDPDDLGDQPRGTAAWERALRHAIDSQVQYSENTGRPVPPPTVVAVIDRAAPIARVRRYLRIVALNDINEILLVTRRPDVASTRTLGAIRVDKMCSLGTVRLSAGLGFLDGYTTWGDFIRATHE